METVGLIPAGGLAYRLGKSPCSKEIFPVQLSDDNRITVVSENVLRYFRIAAIENIFFIVRKGKWDIPEYYGDGTSFNVNIGYLIMNLPFGTPFTVDQAYPFVRDKIVALGYPDILITPEDCYAKTLLKLTSGEADVVLGLFPIKNYKKWDMVEIDENNKLRKIVIKQDRPDLKLGWTTSAWKPVFTEFMHKRLTDFISKNPDGKLPEKNKAGRELYMGDLFQQAIDEGLRVDYVVFTDGSCTDLGTPDDLRSYMKEAFSS